jgi:MYXO-CTERM domain-containing protein
MDSTGAVECAPTPGTNNVGPCICRNNGCTFACEGVTCMGALTCNPRTGACVENTCRGLGCPDGQLCNTTSGACETDPCVAASCTAAQACRGGTCEATCASVTCTAGQLCHAGVCTDDHCIGITCPTGQTCDHTDGTCHVNRCVGVTCQTSETCDPLTGTCNPTDRCAGLHCPAMTMCVAGECVRAVVIPPDAGPNHDAGVVPGTDTGVARVDSGTTTVDDRHRVLAGGGPLCSVGASHTNEGGARALLAMLALAGVVTLRRRRRGGER